MKAQRTQAPDAPSAPSSRRKASLTDEQIKARALQRWENEGGSLKPPAERRDEVPKKSRR